MSPAPIHATGEHPSTDMLTRLVRLEEWRTAQENDARRSDARSLDFEARLRVLEAAHMRMTGKITVLAVAGSAIATGIVQVVIRVIG